MKIDVTYEKVDILDLVTKSLQARGLRLKPGTTLAYKGALEIKLTVEVEDDITTPTSIPAPAVPVMARSPAPASEPAEQVSLDDVLASSRHLAKTTEGKFERPLADNKFMKETVEWPGPPPEND